MKGRYLIMYSYSRKDWLETKLYELAEAGVLFSNNQIALFKSEITRLRKNGFTVTPLFDSKKLVHCEINWSSPFIAGIHPSLVDAYVNHRIDTFPEGLNFAQKLYTIATRKNNE